MPHIVIEYTPADDTPNGEALLKEFHGAAFNSGLFDEGTIKVRSKTYDAALVGGKPAQFAHILVYLIEGRDAATKKKLTTVLHDKAKSIFNGFQSISVDARDLGKAVYTKSTAN